MAAGKVIDFRQNAFYIELARYQALNDKTGMERFLFSCEKKYREENSLALLVAVYSEQGAFYRSAERYRLSSASYKKAQKLIEKLMGKSCVEYATVLNNMAGTYRLSGHYKEALKLLGEALLIYEEIDIAGEGADEEERYMPACVHNNMGQIFRRTGEIQEAIRHLTIALETIRTLPAHAQEAGLIYSNLTTLYQQTGDMDQAMQCLEEALVIFDTASMEKDTQYAQAMGSLAGFLCGNRDYDRAIEVYEKAADDTRASYGNTEEYAVLCQNLCWVYRKTGDDAAAMRVLDEAVEVLTDLFGEKSERVRTIQEERKRLIDNKVV